MKTIKPIKPIRIKFAIMFMLCLIILLLTVIGCGEEGKYPMTVQIISKDDAMYDTPENAFAAMCSSSVKEDLEWYYETLTEEAVVQDKKAFQEAGIDPEYESEMFKKHFNKAYIIDKQPYKNAIVLIVDVHDYDGAIFTLPYTIIEENSKWKITNKFASDDELAEYMDYVKPEQR